MKKNTRRYVFLEYEDLKRVKFRKLEKVCDRVFVFIRKEEKFVPVDLVRKMQRFGRNAKWVLIEGLREEQNMQQHLSYFIGKLHEQSDLGIEFAILSNDTSYDALISYINSEEGRSCIRVKGRKHEAVQAEASPVRKRTAAPRYTLIDEMKSEEELRAFSEPSAPRSVEPPTVINTETNGFHSDASNTLVQSFVDDFTIVAEAEEPEVQEDISDAPSEIFDAKDIISRTAEQTVQRLIRSGNRPALVSTLKNYILLHNQELSVHSNIDRIIDRMESDSKIAVNDGEVVYFF